MLVQLSVNLLRNCSKTPTGLEIKCAALTNNTNLQGTESRKETERNKGPVSRFKSAKMMQPSSSIIIREWVFSIYLIRYVSIVCAADANSLGN